MEIEEGFNHFPPWNFGSLLNFENNKLESSLKFKKAIR